jgi:hypothetical protein
MPQFPRQEIEDFVQLWLDENKACEQTGDWRPLTKFYTEDATYGWNMGPDYDIMCVGIDEIRDIACGQEMDGLLGWTYPYERVIIDDRAGEVVGFWRQRAGTREDGTFYEAYGIGGSWFRYAGNQKWSWQRDFFDYGHVETLFIDLLKAGKLTDQMVQRMTNIAAIPSGHRVPGFYPLGTAPVAIW